MKERSIPSPKELKKQVVQDLGKQILDRRPQQIFLFVLAISTVIAGYITLLGRNNSIFTDLMACVILCLAHSVLVFLAHEAMHGSISSNKQVQNFIGFIGMLPFMVSPTLWRQWHNKNHHGHTNAGNRDPDSFGTLDRYERVKSTRFVTKLAPGSGHWLSYFFLFYWFTFHGQVVLWIQSALLYDFRTLNRKKAIFETGLMFAYWAGLAYIAGPYLSILMIAIPMIVANFTIMSYIATNHFLMPQDPHPLLNSMGVTTLPILDMLHLNFSHHIEHHLFPTMNWKNFPALRKYLKERFPEVYLAPNHKRAISMLYKTPRIYQDDQTLCDPEKTSDHITIAQVHMNLRQAVH